MPPRSRPLTPVSAEAGLRLEAQLAHRLGDQRGGVGLVETGFGVVQDPLAEFDDRVPLAMDRLADRALHFILGHPAPGIALAHAAPGHPTRPRPERLSKARRTPFASGGKPRVVPIGQAYRILPPRGQTLAAEYCPDAGRGEAVSGFERERRFRPDPDWRRAVRRGRLAAGFGS